MYRHPFEQRFEAQLRLIAGAAWRRSGALKVLRRRNPAAFATLVF
jgi:hypothetical protein